MYLLKYYSFYFLSNSLDFKNLSNIVIILDKIISFKIYILLHAYPFVCIFLRYKEWHTKTRKYLSSEVKQ